MACEGCGSIFGERDGEVISPGRREEKRCPGCGERVDASFSYCPYCGRRV
jgi:DNA-directed RNA polymerase subunit RPC12/RpoP